MTLTEIETELKKVKEMLSEQISENIKYRRMAEDLMHNLTFENMPSVKRELDGSIKKISSISADMDGIAQGVSTLEQRVDEQGACISLVVSEEDGENTINTASIVSAINNSQSSIKMSADKIEFEGSNVSFDTDTLKINSDGCVGFSSPVSTPELYADSGNFNGRLDLGSSEGLRGYVYMNAGESDTLELYGDGGIVLSTESESGSADGSIDMYALGLNFNGSRVLTDSYEDIEYLRTALGLY